MQSQAVPHFHNELGVPRVTVGVKEFMCLGALPPNDHPHVFLNMGAATQIVCPYCGTVYFFNPRLEDRCDPPQCAYLAEPQNDLDGLTAKSQHSCEPMDEEYIRGVVVAAFKAGEELENALDCLKARGFDAVRTYSPNGRDDRSASSPLPALTLIGGAIGFIGGFAMEAYANMVSYPLNIGGRPNFSWPSFVPIALEIGMLTAVVTAIFGYVFAAPLFSYYEPIDETAVGRNATDNAWVVAVDTTSASRAQVATRLLNDLGALTVEEASG
jgi:uncharacterized Zn-finger protein